MGRIINGVGWEREKKRKENRECLFSVGTPAGMFKLTVDFVMVACTALVSVSKYTAATVLRTGRLFRFVVTNTDDDVLALTSVVSVLQYTAEVCNRGVLRVLLHS